MSKSAKFWDKAAVKYAKDSIKDVESYEFGLERVRAQLTPEMTALEIGCGTGMTAQKLAPHVDSYLATDISAGMIAQGEIRQKAQPVAGLGFQALPDGLAPLSDGSYDAVLAFNLLHLVPDLDAELAQIHRVLKPGGLFISKTICQPLKFAPMFKFQMLMAQGYMMLNPGLTVNIGTVAALDRAVQRAGFEIVETGNFPAHPPRRFIVGRKR